MNKAKPTPDNPMPLPPYVRPLHPVGAAAMQIQSRGVHATIPRWRLAIGWAVAIAAVAFVLWSGM